MCVIFAVNDFSKCEDFKKNLELAIDRNNDGNSFSFFNAESDKIEFYKDISTHKILKLIESFNLTEFVFHARLTSSGKTIPSLTHAFPLDLKMLSSDKMQGSTKAVLYHNGTLDFEDLANHYLNYCMKNNKKIISGELSDSKLLAVLVKLYGYNFINLFDPRGNSRYIIHDVKGIHYFGSNWKTQDNMKVSNDHFVPIDNSFNNKWESGYYKTKIDTTKQSKLKDGNFSLCNDDEQDLEFSDFEDYLTLQEQIIYDELINNGHSKKLIISWVHIGYTLQEVKDNLNANITDSFKGMC